MSEQARPERPPTSGPGSSIAAWREYAAAVTDSPVESWQSLSREEIVELLDSEGVDTPPETEQPATPAEHPRRRRPQWMVPTDDGNMVPESELPRR